MSTVPKLTIGPVTYKAGTYGPFTWPQTLGLEAPRVLVRMPVEDAAAILAGPREITITMEDSFGRKKTIQRVIVVGEDHSPDALVRTVILTDVRWYLEFGWVRAAYNLVVGTGTFRQVQNDAQATAAPPPRVANFQYVPSSLKNNAPWSSTEEALDVLRLATTNHDFPAITVNDRSRPRTSFIPNNSRVDANGPTAIGQTLGALGGLDIRVEDDGSISIVNAYLGAEKETLDPIVAAYSLEGKGKLRWISMGPVCPPAARVLVTRRLEIRAESYEGAPGPGGNLSTVGDDVVWGTDNTPTMINVAPVTDQKLPPSSDNPFIQGTLIPMSLLCESIAAANDTQAGTPSAAVPITRLYLLAGPNGAGFTSNGVFFPPAIGASPLMSEVLENNYVADKGTGVGNNVPWSARCAAIRQSMRTLYKLNPNFARQCLPGSIKAERAGLLDAVTGLRQPATVYMDYVQRPVGPGIATSDQFGWMVNSIPGTPSGQSFPTGSKAYSDPGPYNESPFRLTSATPAPFNIQCLDNTLGVFFFSPQAQDTSKIKHAAENLPGLVWGLPTNSSGELKRGHLVAFWTQTRRLLTHRVSLIFSATPVGGGRALQSYTVSIEEALARLGAPANSVSPTAPTRELRIREGVAQALIPWDDDGRQARLACFNVSSTNGPIAPDDGLVPVNDIQLRDLAVATFANWVACLLDHFEGTMQIQFTPSVMPVGALRSVSHVFTVDGCYTVLRADGVTPTANPEDMISQSSRNVLFGGLGVASS